MWFLPGPFFHVPVRIFVLGPCCPLSESVRFLHTAMRRDTLCGVGWDERPLYEVQSTAAGGVFLLSREVNGSGGSSLGGGFGLAVFWLSCVG